MAVKMRKIISFILIALLQSLLQSEASFDDCNAIYINGGDAESPGKCTSFPECPVLFDILKSPFKTITEIKLLQKLTCHPDNDNPTVCCALDDIKSDMNNTWFAIDNKRKGDNSLSNDAIVFGVPDSPKETAPEETKAEPFKVHTNFRSLIPPLTECSKAVSGDRILGGQEISILDSPWSARIGYWSLEEGMVKYLCGATVINKRYVLTAAHCTQEINPEEYDPVHIRFAEKDEHCDDIYGCSTPVDIEIERIIPHPDYNKRDKSNDIGLIRVKRDIPYENTPFICPVCLPFVEEYGLSRDDIDPTLRKYLDTGNASAYVSGWGKTRWTSVEGSPTLQQVTLPVISFKNCQRSYQNHTRVSINRMQMCAGGERGKDSCGGDSGGGLFIPQHVPVMAKTKLTKKFQFGVVSFGPTQCGVGGLPGVYSSVYAYKDWILDNLEP